LDNDKPFPAVYLHRFSDLDPNQEKILREAWPKVDVERRFNLIHDLDELATAETVVMFTEVAEIALEDGEAKIRAAAIDLLTDLEDSTHGKLLVQLLKEDTSDLVREHAAIALGFYVYLNALEEIDPKMAILVEDALITTFKSKESPDIRRRCLESLGYSLRNEVPIIIEGAYHSDKTDWVSSALFAMGRSGLERWYDHVLESLSRDEPEILLEAARAAGELYIADALPALLKLVEAENYQGEALQYASIWALSQIGGDQVRDTFDELAAKADEEGDEELLSFLDDAMENLEFNQDMENDLELLEIDLEEMARSGRLIDLDNPTDGEDEENSSPAVDEPPSKEKKRKRN
jgi:hypothetical protein